jgi:hypothetical protein
VKCTGCGGKDSIGLYDGSVAGAYAGAGAIGVLYPGYHETPITAQKIWIWASSLQQQMVGEPRTLYLIWPTTPG